MENVIVICLKILSILAGIFCWSLIVVGGICHTIGGAIRGTKNYVKDVQQIKARS